MSLRLNHKVYTTLEYEPIISVNEISTKESHVHKYALAAQSGRTLMQNLRSISLLNSL